MGQVSFLIIAKDVKYSVTAQASQYDISDCGVFSEIFVYYTQKIFSSLN